MNNELYALNALRHGEVNYHPVDTLPEGLIEVEHTKEFIVGHSETGHHHVAVAEKVTDFQIFRPAGADSEELWMRVTGNVKTEHRKSFDVHETKTIQPGLYKITGSREFNYAMKSVEADRD